MVKFVVIICGNFKVEKEGNWRVRRRLGSAWNFYFSIFFTNRSCSGCKQRTYQQLQNNHAREYTIRLKSISVHGINNSTTNNNNRYHVGNRKTRKPCILQAAMVDHRFSCIREVSSYNPWQQVSTRMGHGDRRHCLKESSSYFAIFIFFSFYQHLY